MMDARKGSESERSIEVDDDMDDKEDSCRSSTSSDH